MCVTDPCLGDGHTGGPRANCHPGNNNGPGNCHPELHNEHPTPGSATRNPKEMQEAINIVTEPYAPDIDHSQS